MTAASCTPGPRPRCRAGCGTTCGTRAGGSSCPAWWTATRTWRSAAGAPRSSSSGSSAGATSRSPRRAVGIVSTMRATRAAATTELAARAARVLEGMLELGVTTVECKSGYGLDREHELRLLRVYAQLGRTAAQRLVPTLLAAHVVPPEYRDRREAYVRLIVEEIIPAVAGERLARCCDAFVEASAFTVDEARRILLAGRAAGLAPRLHADQLSASGGAELAAEVGALSADHLECVTPGGDRGTCAGQAWWR